MTLSEFKAWFEGYTENIVAQPSSSQWERIKARISEVDGTSVTYPIFVERYRPYWDYIRYPAYWTNGTSTMATFGQTVGMNDVQESYSGGSQVLYSSSAAMRALGQAEATMN